MTDSILRKYVSPQAEDSVDNLFAETESFDDLGPFGWLRGIRDRALMLELRKKDGNVLAVGYSWLERAEFDPSLGIVLHIMGKPIHIKGRHLNAEVRPNVRLFQGITRHRVPWVQEADEPTVMETPGKATLVEKIEW